MLTDYYIAFRFSEIRTLLCNEIHLCYFHGIWGQRELIQKKKTHNINTKNLKGDIIIDDTFIKMIFNDITKTYFNMFENLDENS